MVPSMSRATWRMWLKGRVISHHLDRALGHRIHERLAVLLGENAIVQRHNDAGVGLGADEPAHALAELEDGLRQGKLAERIAATRLDGFDARFLPAGGR